MSEPIASAELIEDRGEAAAGDEFFRSRPFLDAEGATHTLRIADEAGELVAPLIVREIDAGPERDAVSPYGYPGIAVSDIDHTRGGSKSDTSLGPAAIDFSATDRKSVV